MNNLLTPEKVEIYNNYVEWLDEDLNFSDHSVGIYWTSKLDKEIVNDIIENSKGIKLIYWDTHTLILRDSGYDITIKMVDIVDESKWIVAEIR